jgi:hypothetical protein
MKKRVIGVAFAAVSSTCCFAADLPVQASHRNSPWFGKADIRMPRGMPKLSIRRQAMSDFDASSGSEAARFMFSGRFVFA